MLMEEIVVGEHCSKQNSYVTCISKSVRAVSACDFTRARHSSLITAKINIRVRSIQPWKKM